MPIQNSKLGKPDFKRVSHTKLQSKVVSVIATGTQSREAISLMLRYYNKTQLPISLDWLLNFEELV
jgi:hypothetical protein